MTAVGEVREDFYSPQMIQAVAAKPWMTWTATFEALCTNIINDSLLERNFNIINYRHPPKALDDLTLDDAVFYKKMQSYICDFWIPNGRDILIRTSLQVGSIFHNNFHNNQDLFDQFSQQRCFNTFGEFLKEKSFCSRYQLLKEQLLEATSLEKQGDVYNSYLKDQGFQLDALYQHLGIEQLRMPRNSQCFMSSLFVMADVAKHLGLKQVLQGDELSLDALKESFSTYDRLAVLGVFPTQDTQRFNVFNSVLVTSVEEDKVGYKYPGQELTYKLPFADLYSSYLIDPNGGNQKGFAYVKKTNMPL